VKDAADYLAYIKALIVAHPLVVRCAIQREEAQGNEGLLRLRLTLRDGGLLDLFERFRIAEGCLQISKYRFHWQDVTGQLRQRWDNAAHYQAVSTYPHHVHVGSEVNVAPHEAVSVADVLAIVLAQTSDLGQ